MPRMLSGMLRKNPRNFAAPIPYQAQCDPIGGGMMNIPKHLQIPAIVLGLQGVMLLGWALVFLIL
jgi:hypothetical protein